MSPFPKKIMTIESTNQVREVRPYMAAGPDNGIAALLEILPGIFLQTFGIGHIYAGKVFRGLIIMLSSWLLLSINLALCHLLIGFVTWPLTFLAFAIFSTIGASNAAKRKRLAQ
jgi:TM2 domain-containing membrane protein YozV